MNPLLFLKQNSETAVVVDNIHNIVAAAAVKFTVQQIENLVTLVKEVSSLVFFVIIRIIVTPTDIPNRRGIDVCLACLFSRNLI